MTEKLDWQYDDRGGEQRATYKGFTIRAVRDQSAANPFEDNDCEWPIAVYAGRSDGFSFYGMDSSELNPIGAFSDAQLAHDQHAIARELGFATVGLLLACEDLAYQDRKLIRHGDRDLLTAFRDVAEREFEATNDSDKLERAAKLYNLAGVPAWCATTRGYSQGDWAEVLVIATKQAQERFGTMVEIKPADLQASVDLYGAWAWGDVFGYVVVAPDGSDDDSCWGFYGDDHGDSGLEEQAMAAVDATIRWRERNRQAKVKELIRNRVPLLARPAALAHASRWNDGQLAA